MGTKLTEGQHAALTEWVRRLRTTDRIQGKGSLHTEVTGEHRYCPLGVACEYAAEQRVVESAQHPMPVRTDNGGVLHTIVHGYDGSISTMSQKLRNYFGIDLMTMYRLIHLNDKAGLTFAEIADHLEEEFLSDHDRNPRPANVDPAQGDGPRTA